MKLILTYFTFAISISFISWIVALLINAFLIKTTFYQQKLTNLQFLTANKNNKYLGLDAFKWIVKNTFFKFFNPKLKLKHKVEMADLINLRNEMTKSEIDHLIGFIFVSIFAIQKVITHQLLFALVIMFVNVLMNLYPSLLQQTNKVRLDRLIKK